MNYLDLKAALQLFDLGERASLQKIKEKHRELVKKHHPDHDAERDPDVIRRINIAYELLRNYCENYQFCFSEEEYLEQTPEERIRRQFSWDPVWSGKEEEN